MPKKIGLWPILINPGKGWNRELICDDCGHHTFIKAREQLTSAWVRCILTSKLECPECHAKCVIRFNPRSVIGLKVNGNEVITTKFIQANNKPEPPRGRYGKLVENRGSGASPDATN